MESFDIDVLGGIFKVHELIRRENQSEAEALDQIRSITPDRWFVLLDEEISGQRRDTLAIVSDDFEFQIVAAGQFEGD